MIFGLAISTLAAVAIAVWLTILLRPIGLVSPILFFFAFEITATWPALAIYSGEGGGLAILPILTAVGGALAAIASFWFLGGFQASANENLRDDSWHCSTRQHAAYLGGGILMLSIILGALACYRYKGVPPLFSAGLMALVDPVSNKGSVEAIREGRRSMTKGHLLGESYAGQGFLNAISETGWQLVVIAVVCRFMIHRTQNSLLLMVFVTIISLGFLGSSGHRAPIAFAMLGAGASFACYRRISAVFVASSAAILFVLLVFVAPLSKGERAGVSISQRASAIGERIAMGNGQNNVAIVKLVNSGDLAKGYGSVFAERLLVMIPGAPSSRPFALRLTELAYGDGKAVTGYSTPTQFGLFWADGGWVGVLVGYVLTGAALALIWTYILRLSQVWSPVVRIQSALILGYTSVTGLQGIAAATVSILVCILIMIAGGHCVLALTSRLPTRSKVQVHFNE